MRSDLAKVREAAEWVQLKHNAYRGDCAYCAGGWPCYYRRLADYALNQKRVREAEKL